MLFLWGGGGRAQQRLSLFGALVNFSVAYVHSRLSFYYGLMMIFDTIWFLLASPIFSMDLCVQIFIFKLYIKKDMLNAIRPDYRIE